MDLVITLLRGGGYEIVDYLSAHVLFCLVPAFFIAGGIAAFVSKGEVLKYFGPEANRLLSYSVASVSGAILAVCSCTILPIFAGIYRRGAGLGPAIAFLYSGPAINLLAIVLTARKLGLDLGAARALGAILLALLLGVIMALLYRAEEQRRALTGGALVIPTDRSSQPGWHLMVFFALLVAILLFGTAAIPAVVKLAILVALVGLLSLALATWFTREEVHTWLGETFRLVKLIFPILLLGVFAAGAIKQVLPPAWISAGVGSNSPGANLLASTSGALWYFSTLTEVPIIKMLLDLGMARGPALALLLAGPALSLPAMLSLARIMGTGKTAAYVILVIMASTVAGMAFGALTA